MEVKQVKLSSPTLSILYHTRKSLMSRYTNASHTAVAHSTERVQSGARGGQSRPKGNQVLETATAEATILSAAWKTYFWTRSIFIHGRCAPMRRRGAERFTRLELPAFRATFFVCPRPVAFPLDARTPRAAPESRLFDTHRERDISWFWSDARERGDLWDRLNYGHSCDARSTVSVRRSVCWLVQMEVWLKRFGTTVILSAGMKVQRNVAYQQSAEALSYKYTKTN